MAGLVAEFGRAMAGLVAAAKSGEFDSDAPIVFWHTGGLPSLFGHGQAVELTQHGIGPLQE